MIYGKFTYCEVEILFIGEGEKYLVTYKRNGKPVGETIHESEFGFMTAKGHFENCIRHAIQYTDNSDLIKFKMEMKNDFA